MFSDSTYMQFMGLSSFGIVGKRVGSGDVSTDPQPQLFLEGVSVPNGNGSNLLLEFDKSSSCTSLCASGVTGMLQVCVSSKLQWALGFPRFM